MCGIAGYYSKKKYDQKVIDNQLKALVHRGPDSEATFHIKNYTGGMRRLSINDLATGDQPLYNEDKSVTVLYNGEIYNYKSLRKELESRKHKFKSGSDGEVICHLYEEYGEDVFEKLDGMFAIALWDDKNEKLILARDIPGEKPLYYYDLNDGVVFASEIKSLVKFPGLNLDLNYQGIWDLPTFLWIPEPDTIYKNVKALLPSHMMVVDKTGTKIKKYENLFGKDLDFTGKSEKEIVREVRTIVEESVKSRLLSDVPVGSFLSGGIDSSIVATIASQNLPRLDTFTIGFENLTGAYHGPFVGKVDESEYAREYAKKLGTNHHLIEVTGKTFLDMLDNFSKYGDQPWGVSSGLGVMAISKMAHELGIKVLLTGDGADESFGGYAWYGQVLNEIKNKFIDREDLSFQDHDLPIEDRVAVMNSYTSHKKAWAWHYYASEKEKEDLFNKDLFKNHESSLRWFSRYNENEKWGPKDFIIQDRLFYMPNEMLKKADRMTMAHSVEGRPPFVAPTILNLAQKLPIEMLIKGDKLKWVLREAFSDIVPNDIAWRPKHGFNVPIDNWLKGDWSHLLEETFGNDSELIKKGIVEKNSLEKVKKMLDQKHRLSGHAIFCYIMLNKWLEQNK
jgi:asparagine synthase (glutamine-hydrolysing)